MARDKYKELTRSMNHKSYQRYLRDISPAATKPTTTVNQRSTTNLSRKASEEDLDSIITQLNKKIELSHSRAVEFLTNTVVRKAKDFNTRQVERTQSLVHPSEWLSRAQHERELS